ERAGDIPGLARYFMKIFAKKFGKDFDRISKKDMQALVSYRWPGNIRELRHVIERAVLLSRNGKLEIPPLNTAEFAGKDPGRDETILTLRDMETRHILRALSACGGKVSGAGGAAELLAVKPTTLYSKMKRLKIQREDYRIKTP
ncbi:MAG: hypothetical protein M0T82_10090, partial [Desulfobacteraceae bacterium]|nr:hypothetical protein [Desulfobacteraceae bacterium]